MNELRPSGSGSEISHNPYALSSFAPSHRRRDSNQTVVPSPNLVSSRAGPPPPPVLILNSLSPVWQTKPSSPKKTRRQSGSGWELSSPSLSTNPTPDDSILGSLRRAVSPFRQPDPLETKSSAYRPPSISTPTSLHSRSNSSSSSIPPITPSEATPPPPPPKQYHYTKRAQTYPIVPYTEATKEMTIATTKRHPELIRGMGVGDTNPSRATSHSDPDLSHQRQHKQKHHHHHHQHHRHHQHDDSSLAAAGADTHAIIRDLGPQSHTQAKPTPVKQRTKGTEISPLPPMIVPSRRKESLPQGFSTSSKDDLNLNTQQSVSKQSDSTFSMSWGRQKDSVKSETRRASSIFLPHLIPNPNFTSHPEARIAEEEEEQEPPGTPGIRRKDERNGWSGEWNLETIQEVIVKLRALR